MIRILDHNAQAFLADLAAQVPRSGHELQLETNVEYAEYLQDRHGYFVFNVDHAAETVVQKLREVIDAGLPLSDRNIVLALDAAGFEEVDWLRSHTAEMRPPAVKPNGDLTGPRPAHPGGWADITGQLANSYGHRVDGGPLKGVQTGGDG